MKRIRKAFEDYKSNFLVEDNVPYYFDRIGELADPKWIPSVEDTLRTRIKTTGLSKLNDTTMLNTEQNSTTII